MADRPPQYNNMVPSGFSMLQQQQAQQQAQQQQQLQQQQAGQQPQPDSHPGPGFSASLWQQQPSMQQQQFRPRSGAGVGPNQAQMNEFMRNQNMARAPSGQSMSFGMGGGMPNMGGQQPFHDPSSNQSANGNMPGGGFPNLGGMMNQGMSPAQAQQQRAGLLAGNPNHQRQLEMMMVHNQSNTPMNFAKFPQQPSMPQRPDQPQQHSQHQPPFLNPGGMNHSSPADIFSPGMPNDALRRNSPSIPPNSMPGVPPNMPGVGNVNPQDREGPMTLAEAQRRATALQFHIRNEENLMNQFVTQARSGNLSDEDRARAQKLAPQIRQKKEYLVRLNALINQHQQNGQQMTGGGGGGPGPGWTGQGTNGAPFDQSIQRNATPMQSSPQVAPGGILQGGNPGMMKPQTPSNQPVTPQQGQQQSTPQQNPGAQRMGPPQGSNGPGPLPGGMPGGQVPFPQGMNGAGRSTPQMQGVGNGNPVAVNPAAIAFPPIDRVVFDRTFKSFCVARNFNFDPSSLVIDGRPVDLYHLHRAVFEMGGFAKVEANSAWDIVGGKLGFVNFPGSDGQPPRSGPGISLQLTSYYKEYVQAFDAAYARSMLENKVKANYGIPELNDQQKQHIVNMVKNITGFDLNAATRVPPPPPPLPTQKEQMAQLISLAQYTVPELQRQGVPSPAIRMIEAHRSDLQRLHQDQINFQAMAQRNGGKGPMPGQQFHPMQNGKPGPGAMGGRPMQPPFGTVSGGMPGQLQGARGMQGGMVGPQGGFMDGRLQGPHIMPQIGGQLGPPLPQHQQTVLGQQQRMPVQMLGGPFPTAATIPTKEQTQIAIQTLARYRQEAQDALTNLPSLEVPVEQRAAYNATLESVHLKCNEIDGKLPILYSLIKNDEQMRRVVRIIATVQLQRSLCSQNSPRIIISADNLRNAQAELVRLNDAFGVAMRQAEAIRAQAAQQLQSQQPFMQPHLQQPQMQMGLPHQMSLQQSGMNSMSPPGGRIPDHVRPPMPGQLQPPSAIPHPPQQTTPNLAAQQLRQPVMPLNPPPPRRQPKQGTSSMTPGAMQSPSPAAASTPPNAATPNTMMSSPSQAPKSPKTKAPKAKPAAATKRRPSKVAPSPAATAQTPQSHTSPEASTSTPTQSHASIKRQREEETAPSPGPANGPSPPKRAKMDENQPGSSAPSRAQQKAPEAGPSAPVKKEDMASEIANIKTDEDASQLFNTFAEMIKNAATNPDGTVDQSGAEALSGDLSETLEALLKGCGPADTGGDGLGGFGSFGAPPREGTPPPSLFDEYFDFSNTGEEEDSKFDTPELVSSSSTNPSPESNASEVSDAHYHQFQQHQQFGMSGSMPGSKTGFDEIAEAVRLGPWKEIDGGEAAYYQSNEWKWEGPMTTVDAPWAIFQP